MGVLPGAEPIDLAGGPVGVLLCHGFTGTTQSVRPWADHLAAAGLTVRAPRLPGHGTRWQDLGGTTFDDWYAEALAGLEVLSGRCRTVFAMGLSMGGTIVLRLAELRQDVAGVVVVNASLGTDHKLARLAPLLSRAVPSFPGIASDIARPGVTELAYDRVPLKAFVSLQHAWPVVAGDLPRITCPVLAYRSRIDHVVPPVSGQLLVDGLAGGGVRKSLLSEVVLERSYHVATLDYDADLIFAGSLDFVRTRAPAAAGEPEALVAAHEARRPS